MSNNVSIAIRESSFKESVELAGGRYVGRSKFYIEKPRGSKRIPVPYDGVILFNGITIFVLFKFKMRALTAEQKAFRVICADTGTRHFVLRYFPNHNAWAAANTSGYARIVKHVSQLLLILKEGF